MTDPASRTSLVEGPSAARLAPPRTSLRARIRLSISKQLVEIMGGDLILESREGAGTTVRFTIPELPEADATPPPPTAPFRTRCPW